VGQVDESVRPALPWRQLLVAPDDRYALIAELIGRALEVIDGEDEELVSGGQQMIWGIGE
jgi:hypothetical protein